MRELKEEGILKTSSFMVSRYQSVVYEVGGERLTGADMKTLKGTNWLNDNV